MCGVNGAGIVKEDGATVVVAPTPELAPDSI